MSTLQLRTHTIETYHGTHHTGLLEERIRRKLCVCAGHPAGWSSAMCLCLSVHVHVSVCTHNTVYLVRGPMELI